MLSREEDEKIRSEIALTESGILEIDAAIRNFTEKIEQVRDELGDEEDVRSTKEENRTFYLTITHIVNKLRSELGLLFERRSDLFSKRDDLWERKRALYERLNSC